MTLVVDHVHAQESGVEEYQKVNDMFVTAQKSLLEGKYRDSIKIYHELLEDDPKNYKILDQ